MTDLWLAELANRIWPPLLDHLWQSTLFALAVVPAVALLRRSPARVRYALCLLASAKFVLPSALLATLLVPWLPGAFPALDLAALHPALAVLPSGGAAGGGAAAGSGALFALLTLIWLAGSLALAARWLVRQRRFAALLGRARWVEEGPIFELLESARARLGIRRPVRLAMLAAAVEPGVWGVRRPTLVLPAEMPQHLSREELGALFLHELVHVGRRDNLVANLHMLVCCMFWFHPAVWLLDRRLLAEREAACDERVVELCGRAETYAQGLLKAVRFSIGWRLAGVSGASAANFLRRIERIRSGAGRRRPSVLDRGLLAAVLALWVAFTLGAGGGVENLSRAAAPAVERAAPTAAPDRCLKAKRSAAAELGFRLPSEPPPTPGDGGC